MHRALVDMIPMLHQYGPCKPPGYAVWHGRVAEMRLLSRRFKESGDATQKRNLARSPVTYAKPNAKLPARTVQVLCAACRSPLYKYHKNGNGKLVKCWHERIAEDYTNKDLKCPQCGQQFARETMVRGLPANKIIGGKVTMKR